MNHVVLVRIFDRLADAADQLGGLAGLQRTFGQALGEAFSFDEAHREIVLALVLPDLVDRHDARMIEFGGSLGFDIKAADGIVVGELACQDHLQGDLAVEAHLTRLEDDAHAAACELADDFVVAEVANAIWILCVPLAGRGVAEVDGGFPVRCRDCLRGEIVHGLEARAMHRRDHGGLVWRRYLVAWANDGGWRGANCRRVGDRHGRSRAGPLK